MAEFNEIINAAKKLPVEDDDIDEDDINQSDSAEWGAISNYVQDFPWEYDEEEETVTVGAVSEPILDDLNDLPRNPYAKPAEHHQADYYSAAKQIMEKFDFCYLDADQGLNDISIFNGRVWQSLSDQQLDQIVYDQLSVGTKTTILDIKRYCRHVSNYIVYETRKNSRERFTPEQFKQVENRVVFSNGVDGIHLYSTVLSGIICVKYDCIKSDLGRIKEHNPASKEDRQ